MSNQPSSAHPPMTTVEFADLRDVFGFGVAGNFAGHLDQAGEAADFVGVATEAEAPKGIFPWFVPLAADDPSAAAAQIPSFLRVFPLSHDQIAAPAWAIEDPTANIQIEPELGVFAHVTYDGDGTVRTLRPYAAGAFNDCSIRRPGATKISQKKNWGPNSKGIAQRLFALTDLTSTGPTASFRLACFLTRDGQTQAYGVDSPLPGYSYYGNQLVVWLMERLANQTGSADTPLEPVGAYLRAAGLPRTVLIGIGATRYTAVGETTFLLPGDESIVVVYDGAHTAPEQIAQAIAERRDDDLPAASVLRQLVYAVG